MKLVDQKIDKNTVTAVLRYFKNNKEKINTRAAYLGLGGFSTEKFSIDDTDTQYSISFNTLSLFSNIKATIFQSDSLVYLEEVSIIKNRSAIVPGKYFLVDPDLYDYILYKLRMSIKESKENSINQYEIKL